MKDIALNTDKISLKVKKIKQINEELVLSLSGMIEEIKDKHNQLCFAWNQISELCSEDIFNRQAFFEINALQELGYSPYFCAEFQESFVGRNKKDGITLSKIIEHMDIVIKRLNEWAEN